MSAIRDIGGVIEIVRDADDVLDYVLDFSAWLNSDTLSAVTSAATGVTVGSALVNISTLTVYENGVSRTIAAGKAIVLWLSGGVEAVPGTIDLRIITTGARTRDIAIRVLPRSSRLRR